MIEITVELGVRGLRVWGPACLLWLANASCAATVPLPPQALALNAAGARAIAEGQLGVAEARLSVALEYSPRFVEAWVNLGYVELGRGNFEQARGDFLRARDLNQDIPDAASRPRPPGRRAGARRRGRTSLPSAL